MLKGYCFFYNIPLFWQHKRYNFTETKWRRQKSSSNTDQSTHISSRAFIATMQGNYYTKILFAEISCKAINGFNCSLQKEDSVTWWSHSIQDKSYFSLVTKKYFPFSRNNPSSTPDLTLSPAVFLGQELQFIFSCFTCFKWEEGKREDW